jgi:excisionase family DNA binding protein
LLTYAVEFSLNRKFLQCRYDRKTAAMVLSISVRSLDYLAAEGSIRVRRLGGRVLITRKELERFAAEDRSEPLAA